MSTQLIPVVFHQDQLLIINHEDQPYVPMKPIVKGMGLTWQRQHEKLRACKDKFNYHHMVTVAKDGKQRKMFCIPLKKLNGWLFSINPEKVKPEIREKVVAYQEECFAVLHDYWTKGYAVNPRATITSRQQYLLHQIVHQKASLVVKDLRREFYPHIWRALKNRCHVASYRDLPESQFEEARQFLESFAIEGEWLPRQEKRDDRYNFPAEIAMPADNLNQHQAWMYIANMLNPKSGDPQLELIKRLQEDGYNVDGLKIQYDAQREALRMISELAPQVESLRNALNGALRRGMNVVWEKEGGCHYLGGTTNFKS